METISMNRKERVRLEVFSRVSAREMTIAKGAEVLGVSYRQAKRLWARYQGQGDEGLVHRLRGRASNRRSDGELKARVLELYRTKYSDYGPTLASECMSGEDGVTVVPETLRRWLQSSGQWPAARRRKIHRRRRARKEQLGELVQMDGSHHDWFEGRRGEAVLMVMIDDATGAIYAHFFEEETLSAAFETFGRYVGRSGVPRALYVDRASIYRADREPTGEELLAGKEPQTQFGRAMEELGVRLILARSPQAKGRVERCNGTLQDRLVKALRRSAIADLEVANEFLESGFLEQFNQRFSVAAQQGGDLHQVSGLDLDRILAVREERSVRNDWTVRWRNRWLQLPSGEAHVVRPKDTVQVYEQLDGRVRLFLGDRELAWSAASATAAAGRRTRPARSGPTGSSQGQKPAATHPWRGRGRVTPLPAAGPELACSASVR